MVPAGWYSDPWGQAEYRWWDGRQWTPHTIDPTPTTPPQSTARPTSLARLAGGGQRIAVVDVETTGLYRSDRVLEIAIVTIDGTGQITDEFDCLINPRRDVGPTWLHRINASMLLHAPEFSEVAPHIAARLTGAVVAGHNLRFDTRMLETELSNAGVGIDWGRGIDTLAVTRCRLDQACSEHGIDLSGAHRALNDARATARLLIRLAERFEHEAIPAAVPRVPAVRKFRSVTRDGHVEVDVPAPYLVELARGLHASTPDIAPYQALLAQAVADLKLTAEEREELAAIAADLGLVKHQVGQAHREFIVDLVDAALLDSVVTDDELDQLRRSAALLDVDQALVFRRTDAYRTTKDVLELTSGMGVCFTGDAADTAGKPIERNELELITLRFGYRVVPGVSAKGCDLLVAADPSTSSRKAENARRYNVPIAKADEYLQAIRAGVPVPVRRLNSGGLTLVCTLCGSSWAATRNTSNPVCAGCR